MSVKQAKNAASLVDLFPNEVEIVVIIPEIAAIIKSIITSSVHSLISPIMSSDSIFNISVGFTTNHPSYSSPPFD